MTIKLKLNRKADQRGNTLGFKKIEIIKFNYIGNGHHLVRFDNDNFLSSLGDDDLDLALIGTAELYGWIDEKDRHRSNRNYYILQEITEAVQE